MEKLFIIKSPSGLHARPAALLDLEGIKERTRQTIGPDEAEIFSAHILVLQDPEYSGAITEMIRSEERNAEWAVQVVTDKFLELFASMDNDYIQERAADLRDVSSRLLRHLLGITTQSCHQSQCL